MSWYQFTTNCGYTDLAQACLNFIKWASIWNTSCLLHTSAVILFAFQVEFHSGVLLDRLAAPWAGLFTSHPGVQWSRHSGWTSRVIMEQEHPQRKCFQGEVTVFRAVEKWLCARREEMAKEGEEDNFVEYWDEEGIFGTDCEFRWREHWGSHGEAHNSSSGTCQVHLFEFEIHWAVQTFLTLTLPRFPMMRPSQLADLLLSPLTTDYMPFMMGRMQAAMGYHRFCLELWFLLIQTDHLTLKF